MTTDAPPTTIADFILARVAEDEAVTWRLVPYACPPDCCAPAGWVGRECLICNEGVSYGGTVEAITEIAEEHAERVHGRSRVLAECAAKRAIVASLHLLASRYHDGETYTAADEALVFTIRHLAAVYSDHPDYRDEWRP